MIRPRHRLLTALLCHVDVAGVQHSARGCSLKSRCGLIWRVLAMHRDLWPLADVRGLQGRKIAASRFCPQWAAGGPILIARACWDAADPLRMARANCRRCAFSVEAKVIADLAQRACQRGYTVASTAVKAARHARKPRVDRSGQLLGIKKPRPRRYAGTGQAAIAAIKVDR